MDRRESILARVLALSLTISGISNAYRNKPEVNEDDLDIIVITDGDETDDERDPDGARPTNAPRRIAMHPSIEIIASGAPEDIGTKINRYRAAMIKAVCRDATLIGYTNDKMGIRYLGCVTGAGLGSTMAAHMVLNFAFSYRLAPDEL